MAHLKRWLPLYFLLFAPSAFTPLFAQTQALTEDQKCLQVLNRLTFGPKPGDLEQVKKMGIDAFLKEQLNPEKLDDALCDKDLKSYPTLTESINSLLMEYPQPGVNIMRPDLRNKVLSPSENEKAYGRIYSMLSELSAAKLTRVLESRRQLYEVMVDFWFNHFNVSFDKNEVEWSMGVYEREAIRPFALGKFKDLLLAVAKSPAMMLYLDNNDNFADPNFKPVADTSMGAKGGSMMMMQSMPGKGLRINENYGRELLELHTLGVDGGYTQLDVVNTARVFTGWSVAGIQPDSAPQPVEFKFKPWHHDTNEKVILGQTFGPNDGVKEGEAVIEMLSRRPETAHRIALKLCQRFLADDPPAALVKTVADKFLASDGDIKETLLAIINSPEFFDPQYYRVKVKTPFEFVASAMRAVDAHLTDWNPSIQVLESMGQPLYRCEAPTGYPLTANAWVSSASLLGRTNFAAKLFDPAEKNAPVFSLTPFETGAAGGGGTAVLQNVSKVLLNGEMSDSTRQALLNGQTSLDTRKMAALVMASPDFQRR